MTIASARPANDAPVLLPLEVTLENPGQAVTLALDADNVTAYSNRGKARKDQGDFTGALADFDQSKPRHMLRTTLLGEPSGYLTDRAEA